MHIWELICVAHGIELECATVALPRNISEASRVACIPFGVSFGFHLSGSFGLLTVK